MQISSHHPSLKAAEDAQNSKIGHGPKQQGSPPVNANKNTAGDEPAVIVELSAKTQAMLGSEKAAHSTAHQARLYIQNNPEHGLRNFGQVVSQFARGLLSLSAPEPAPPAVVTPAETSAEPTADAVEETPATVPDGNQTGAG